MHLRRLGAAGPYVSVLGLGCNNFGRRIDYDRARAVVDAALAEGVTFLDTADTYGDGDSERFIARALGGRRGDVVLATKFGGGENRKEPPHGAPEFARRALEASLGRLETDHVDVLYYHFPDEVTPVAETIGAMAQFVREGKVRHIAVSNLDAAELAKAHAASEAEGTPLVAYQGEYSLLARDAERELLPFAREHGLAFVPYFPLASGLLTGKYRRGEPPPAGTRLAGRDIDDARLARVEELRREAEARGISLLALALGTLAATPGIPSVIAGATSPEQVRANAEALAAYAAAV